MRDINELHMFVDNYRYEVINRKLMYNSDRYVWRYDIICAAYIIVTKDFKIYIGSSNNFWRRLNKHIGMMKKGNYKIDNILRVYVLETKIPHHTIMEDNLIKLLKPELNGLPAHYNMVKITVEISDDYDKKLRHVLAEKLVSSKAGYIEMVIRNHLDKINLKEVV